MLLEGDTSKDTEDLRLELVLQEASMDNKTVILTTLNAAWASPGSAIDLFIDSFHRGVGTSSLLRHLVIVIGRHINDVSRSSRTALLLQLRMWSCGLTRR